MPILNYTTQIQTYKTVGEIQRILAKAGALSVSVDYDSQSEPSAITFFIYVKDNPVNFRLPSRWNGVFDNLKSDKQVLKKFKTEEQARRVSWRIVKDWIEAQMAIVEVELATLPEVFLPYAITKNGLTIYQEFEENQLLLQSGK